MVPDPYDTDRPETLFERLLREKYEFSPEEIRRTLLALLEVCPECFDAEQGCQCCNDE